VVAVDGQPRPMDASVMIDHPLLWRAYASFRKPRTASVMRAAATAVGTSCILTILAPFMMQRTAEVAGRAGNEDDRPQV